MIVFFIFLINILLILTMNITISIDRFEIKNVNDLSKIINLCINKNNNLIFDYTHLNICISVKILKFLPFIRIKLNQHKLKNIIIKFIERDNKLKKTNLKKYKREKKIQFKLINKLLKKIDIENLNLNISLGFVEADLTAITTGFIEILLYFIYLGYYEYFLAERNKKLDMINYNIIPVYNNDLYFNVKGNLKLSFLLYKLV